MLVEYFVKRYAEKAGKQIRKIDKDMLELCETYHWPGNIRELQNIIERSVILCSDDTLSVDGAWFSSQAKPQPHSSGPLTESLLIHEKGHYRNRFGREQRTSRRAGWSGCEAGNPSFYAGLENQTIQNKQA